MKSIRETFSQAINASFQAYGKRGGSRSTKKLLPIHSFFAEHIAKKIGEGYSIASLGFGDGKECCVEGKYYPKNSDITICKSGKPIVVISLKFVTSNYKQNANNYFENLMGETANIRRVNIAFGHFLILRGHTPYYSKNKGNLRGKEMKMEILSEKHLQKYIRLFYDMDFPHKPDLLGMCLIDFDDEGRVFFVNFDELSFSEETKWVLLEKLSLETFLEKCIHLIALKS
jgi:hypothetical protein